MSPAPRLARLLTAVLTLLAVLHAYWALGGQWGLEAALGGPTAAVPPAWSIWLVVVFLLLGASVPLGRIGAWGRGLPDWLFEIGCWGLVVVLVLVAVINATGRTWTERLAFAPFALLLASAAGVVARSPRRAT